MEDIKKAAPFVITGVLASAFLSAGISRPFGVPPMFFAGVLGVGASHGVAFKAGQFMSAKSNASKELEAISSEEKSTHNLS